MLTALALNKGCNSLDSVKSFVKYAPTAKLRQLAFGNRVFDNGRFKASSWGRGVEMAGVRYAAE